MQQSGLNIFHVKRIDQNLKSASTRRSASLLPSAINEGAYLGEKVNRKRTDQQRKDSKRIKNK
jgi:hypothetical protein